MYSISAASNPPALGAGRMQSTGHTGMQLASLQQFCVMTYATVTPLPAI
ncbi:hypothetical protein [Mycolicibacterium llatzerense]|nr:hypothetical protein [Mycolicibacterium llatzerense]